MPLIAGTPAPWFHAPTHANPNYAFSSLGGQYVLLAFLPRDPAVREEMLATLQLHRGLFDDRNRVAFTVGQDPEVHGRLQEQRPGVRHFLDADGAIAASYGLAEPSGEAVPQWVLLDPTLRVFFSAPATEAVTAFDVIRSLADPDEHAGTPLHAPVLVVPRVLEPALCRQLIAFYEQEGGRPSGTMRDVNGKTIGVLSSFKKRSDAAITDEAMKTALRTRIVSRLLPEIQKAFMFNVTRMERYIVARYDAEEGGYFLPHRDNTTLGTAHRQFACSINLNADEFEGGDLRFPEFGRRLYRPPTGGAVVFSCALLHEATPVTRGSRYAFLPFFYNEQGKRIREANAHALQPAEAMAG